MGGIIIILVVTAILAFFVKDYPILIMPMVAIFGYGVVGFLDDFKKLILKDDTEKLELCKKFYNEYKRLPTSREKYKDFNIGSFIVFGYQFGQ